jgi:predicted ATPase
MLYIKINNYINQIQKTTTNILKYITFHVVYFVDPEKELWQCLKASYFKIKKNYYIHFIKFGGIKITITNIKASNFKSFQEIDVDLKNFNVIIGSNASGKSNFVHLLKFLKDILDYDLRNAISIQGGVEYLRNIQLNKSKNLFIELTVDTRMRAKLEENKGIKIYRTIYGFEIGFTNEKPGFHVINDYLSYDVSFHEIKINNEKDELGEEIGSFSFSLHNIDGEIKFEHITEPENLEEDPEINKFIGSLKEQVESVSKQMEDNSIILESPLVFLPFPILIRVFQNISIYDVDPKHAKKAIATTGKADLEEDGSNLAIVLQETLEDEDNKRKLINLMTNLLPFVTDVGIESFVDSSLIVKVKESYSKNKELPASLMSDGSISVLVLILALYFESENGDIIIFEEPERNIHPHLISKLIDMLEETSEKKQIIITTHNPEFVKHVKLEDIIYISRNENGYSDISRICDKKEIKIFLQNEIGIEELYVDNLLGD